MFDDASLAVPLDRPVTIYGHVAVLNVQLLKAAAIVGYELYSLVGDAVAGFHAEFLDVGAVLGQQLQTMVGDVTLTDVERAQARAWPGNDAHAVVGHGLTPSDV